MCLRLDGKLALLDLLLEKTHRLSNLMRALSFLAIIETSLAASSSGCFSEAGSLSGTSLMGKGISETLFRLELSPSPDGEHSSCDAILSARVRRLTNLLGHAPAPLRA